MFILRDLLVTLLVFGAIPWILARPYAGVLVYSWLGYMNPHRFTWGFAFNFPFSQVIAVVTVLALLFSGEQKRIPWTRVTFVWLLFIIWMNLTTLTALNPEDAVLEWDRTMKIQFMSLVTLLLINSRHKINALVWVIVVSLGFFGVKGGIFSILTGGEYLIWGPRRSFIYGNNEIAFALIMTLPLMRYLHLVTTQKFLRWCLGGAMILTALAILTSHSRGALLAAAAMGIFLVFKSPNRLRFGIATVLAVPVLLLLMPDIWFERMSTISHYQQDASAMARLNSWGFAINLALDNPLLGGGFRTFTSELFLRYAADPDVVFDAHSIYFEVLAEHGFVGLGLYLALGFFALRTGTRVMRLTAGRDDWRWAHHLAAMLQVSLVGYAVGGAFLGLAYFDLYYHLLALMVIVHDVVIRGMVRQEMRAKKDVGVEQAHGAAGDKAT